MTLYPHQQDFINKDQERSGLWHDTGTGKTITTIAWAEHHNIIRLVVVCPKIVFPKWVQSFVDFGGGIIAEQEPRIAKLKIGNRKVIITTKEYWRDKVLAQKNPIRADGFACDESHYFANNSKLTKKTLKWLKLVNPKYRLVMSATPYVSSCMNIYYAAQLLGRDVDFWWWRTNFQRQRQFGARAIWEDKTDQETRRRLQQIIKELGHVLTKGDIYEVPDQVQTISKIKQTEQLKQEIDNIDDESFIAFFTKRHQVEQKIKIAPVMRLSKKYKRKIIVARYTEQAQHIHQSVPGSVLLDGSVKDKSGHITSLQDQDEYTVVVQASISEGWELPDAEAIIFASHSWSYKDLYQMCGRAIRMNNPSETQIHHVLVEGGSDERIWQALSNKKDFSIQKLAK